MKIKIAIGFFFILSTFAVVGYYFFSDDTQERFEVEKVEKGDISIEILSTGRVRPENRVEIIPPVSGRIENVLVQEGQEVVRGEVLAWMSSTERAALLDAARSRGDEEFQKWENLYRATPILAPINGTIIRREVESGQAISSSSSPILVMSDRLIIEALVDETDIAKISSSQPVEVTLDAYPEDKIEAYVESIAFEAENESGVTNYAIRIITKTVPDFMRSGMTANVSFIVNSKEDVILVKTQALKFDDDQTFIEVISQGKEVERRLVKTGLNDGLFVEIKEGLSVGEQVKIPQFGLSGRSRGGSSPL